MPKFQVEFAGFDQVISKLKRLDGDVKSVTEKALKETHKTVTTKAEEAIAKHHRTGRTESTLERSADVEWSSEVATVNVGFNIRNGGLASIFLMYGTPRVSKDQKLYNAFYGSATRTEVLKLQEDIFYEEIRRLNG